MEQICKNCKWGKKIINDIHECEKGWGRLVGWKRLEAPPTWGCNCWQASDTYLKTFGKQD